MKTLVRIGALLLVIAPAIGCGDDSEVPADDDVARQSTALPVNVDPEFDGPTVGEDASEDLSEEAGGAEGGAEAEGEAGDDSAIVEDGLLGAAGPAQGDPTYIVYAVPLPGSNLYGAVRSFLDAHPSRATKLPPHVTVTGFFDKSWTPHAAGSRFRKAVFSVGTPFGHAPRITHVGCRTTSNGKNWLVYLKVSTSGPRWQKFIDAVNAWLEVPGGQRKSLASWHITLYEASKTSASKHHYASVCAAAQSYFKGKAYAHNPWGTALFQRTASGGVAQVPDTGFQIAK